MRFENPLGLQRRVVRNARRRGVQVITREQWGSQYPWVYADRLKNRRVNVKKADTLVEHITVTFDSGNLIGDFFVDMRTIERIGMERFGAGFSYNTATDFKTGMIGIGMPFLAKGTHTVNDKGVPGFSYDQNHAARAMAWIGMPGNKPTKLAMEKHAQFIAAMMDEGAITLSPDFLPHSFFAAKDCPTDSIRDAMPWILNRAKEVRRKKPIRAGRR